MSIYEYLILHNYTNNAHYPSIGQISVRQRPDTSYINTHTIKLSTHTSTFKCTHTRYETIVWDELFSTRMRHSTRHSSTLSQPGVLLSLDVMGKLLSQPNHSGSVTTRTHLTRVHWELVLSIKRNAVFVVHMNQQQLLSARHVVTLLAVILARVGPPSTLTTRLPVHDECVRSDKRLLTCTTLPVHDECVRGSKRLLTCTTLPVHDECVRSDKRLLTCATLPMHDKCVRGGKRLLTCVTLPVFIFTAVICHSF